MNERWAVPMVKLERLVSYGSGARGLFSARGQGELARAVAERIADVFSDELHDGSQHRATLGSIVWVDADRSFDPALIADAALGQGLDPKRVLRLVKVVRPEGGATAEFLENVAPSPALIRRSSNGERSTISLVPLVILSDILARQQSFAGYSAGGYESWLERVSRLGRKTIMLGLDEASEDDEVNRERRRILSRYARPVSAERAVEGFSARPARASTERRWQWPARTGSVRPLVGRGWQPVAAW